MVKAHLRVPSQDDTTARRIDFITNYSSHGDCYASGCVLVLSRQAGQVARYQAQIILYRFQFPILLSHNFSHRTSLSAKWLSGAGRMIRIGCPSATGCLCLGRWKEGRDYL